MLSLELFLLQHERVSAMKRNMREMFEMSLNDEILVNVRMGDSFYEVKNGKNLFFTNFMGDSFNDVDTF